MPFVWNQPVADYRAEVFEASTLNYDRQITLTLEDGDTVAVRFPVSAPADFVSIGASFHQVQLDRAKYDGVYHLLQTEKPVFFTAFETDGPSPIRFAGLSTGPESVGEGLADSS